jgi:hypothetical protein
MDLADGYPDPIKRQVTDVLLNQPWQQLINYGYIADKRETGSYSVTSDGYQAAIECAHNPNRMTSQEVQSAIKVLHKDFQGYEHYFREGKLKEAVAAAFERVENRLNEIRDQSRKAAVKAEKGHSLVYALFRERLLKVPYPKLGRGDRANLEKSLLGLLSGALGWIRNPYTHEKHHLPDLEPQEALELLFVASYLMRTIEKSIPLRKAKKP